MKKLITMLSALLLTALGVDSYAQKTKTENDYNLKKAYEVLRDDKDEAKALELVNDQLSVTPDNIDALLLKTRLLRHKRDRGAALRTINHAIEVNKPKRSGTPNSTLYWWKAFIYDDMRDYDNATAWFKKAYDLSKKDSKDQRQNIGFNYAQSLYNQGKREEADAVYRQMLSEDETELGAMVGLARGMIDRGEYAEALEMLGRCNRMDSDYSEVYRFMMQAYDKQGETTKAVDAALDWLDRDSDASTSQIVEVLSRKANYAEASLKARARKSDSPFRWKAFLAHFYEKTHQYAKAVKAYDELEEEFGHYPEINGLRSICYSELGLYGQAIEDINKAMGKDPDWDDLRRRADYYRLSGDLDAAIDDFTAAIEDNPREGFLYYRRGWVWEMKGDRRKALDDYNMGIELDDDYPYLYLMRGELLLLEGNRAEAEEDFREILRRDTVVWEGSCRQYALHLLGRDKEAEEWMDGIIAKDPDDAGEYYDKACLYARMGRLDESVATLRTALEKGYRSFAHIRHDDDMDPVRDLPEFKALIKEYEALHAEYLKEFELKMPSSGETITEIDVKRSSGGTFEIPCDINGLPLQMIFDTGASDVTISSVEANFMFKNGYLSEKDVKGKKYYQIADGQLSEGTVITLRDVKIGDAVLHNVDASVVKSQRAPLLFGQSAMERFGAITIDNQNNRLIIKH